MLELTAQEPEWTSHQSQIMADPPGPQESQAQRVAALGAIAAEVVHEFRNLLTIVASSLEQLRRQPLDPRAQELLRRADWGTTQATRLTGQVLSFARADYQVLELVDLNEVVRRFECTVAQVAGEAVQLATELDAQPLPARLDVSQLELALLNLVRNAVDAMGEGGRVVVRTSRRASDGAAVEPWVEVSVADSGPGMPPDVVQHAGEAFFTTKRPGRGTGLGLWIVRRFVESCGGKVLIETASGQGTKIRLLLPRVN